MTAPSPPAPDGARRPGPERRGFPWLRDRMVAPLADALALYGGLMLLVIVAMTVVNAAGFGLDAVARTWGGAVPGLSGYEEIVALLVGGAALSFLPWCQMQGGHVVVDLFTQRLPRPVIRAIDRLTHGLTAGLALFLGSRMIAGMLEARADGVVSSVHSWPEWPFWVPGVIATLTWSLTAAVLALAPAGTRRAWDPGSWEPGHG